MDRGKIIDALGLVPGGDFHITDLQIVQWGRDVIFVCEYATMQPDDTPDDVVEFQLCFRDCRDLRWKTYAHIALAETGTVASRTEIVEMALGSGSHRRDANLLTTHFAATISYGKLLVERGEHSHVLAN